MTRMQALQRLLQPRSIAVIGGDSAAEVARQCRAIEFDGELWAVNPNRAALGGIACLESIEQLPGVPDASFVAAPPKTSLQIIQTLAELGAPGAVCFASGFAEVGEEGARLQRELRDVCGEMAIIGPNCHGYLNYLDGIALWPDQHGGERVASGVALVLQSGNIGISMTMQQRGLDLGYVISVGNNGTLGIHDYVETLLDDSRVTAIGLHIEGIEDVTAFSVAAIKALEKGVPVVALKTGRSARGSEITLSHTGSLAGSDELYDALFERVGIARCDTVSQFLETLKFLSLVGPLADNTVGSMSCSGGDASLVADCADRLGLKVPRLSDETAANLETLLGPNVHVCNPLDYHLYIWGDVDKLRACFTEVLRNAFACVLLVLDYPRGEATNTEKWEIAERALVDAVAATGRPAVIVSTLPESLPTIVRARLKTAGIAPMQGVEDCLYAIRAAAFVGRSQASAETVLPVMAPAQTCGSVKTLDEWESKRLLSEFGVPIPAGRLCNAAEVLVAADALEYPVVLKGVSDSLAHKTEAGAVALDLPDRAALSEALGAMQGRFDRFIVEEMQGPTVVEVLVGINKDAQFGLSVLLGVGGTLVELIRDTATLLLPLQRADVERTIDALKVAKLIDGYRGQSAGDREALISAVERVGRFAEVHAESLHELDVNPLLVMPHGVVAADVLVRKT